MQSDKLAKIRDLIEKIELPRYSVNVFGSVRVNIHIVCEGYGTAEKWYNVLAKFCTQVNIVEHVIYNKKNQKTTLNPSRRIGYLVGGVI